MYGEPHTPGAEDAWPKPLASRPVGLMKNSAPPVDLGSQPIKQNWCPYHVSQQL